MAKEIFEIKDTVLIRYNGDETSIVIPEGVTKINRLVFRYNLKLENVVLPSTLVHIGHHAFLGCKYLKQIIIPKSVTRIDHHAFKKCTNLSFVSIPSTTFIHDTTFEWCPKLADSDGFVIVNGILFGYYGSRQEVTIPNDVTHIGPAFSGYYRLKSVTIPDSVTSIGKYAFSGCNHLESIHIPNLLFDISDSAFNRCESLADEQGLLILNNHLLEYFGETKNLVIPNFVQSISPFAFKHSSLESVQIPEGITKIDVGVFKNCKKLKKVILPDTIQEILYEAFMGCENLKEINIPQTIECIEKGAFSGCDSLIDKKAIEEAEMDFDPIGNIMA